MIEFPDIGAPDYNGFDETHEDHTDRVTFEDKTIATRRKVTGKTKSWSLVWENMKTKDWNTLTNFYDYVAFQGALPFAWKYPEDPGNGQSGTTVKARFKGNLKGTLAGFNRWKVTVEMEEV